MGISDQRQRDKHRDFIDAREFQKLIALLKSYSGQDISLDSLKTDIRNISGIGLSTISKLLTFLGTRINGMKAAILDLRISDVINSGRFEELNSLSPIRYDNAIQKYGTYLEVLNKLAAEMEVEIDQIEMFLFIFGKSLAEIKAEYCYDFD